MTLALSSRARRARRLADAVLTAHADALPRAVPGAANFTSTGLAIVPAAPPGQPPSAVIKLALSAAAERALVREGAFLSALHRDQRLGAWRELLPRALAHGIVQNHPYRVERALAGQAALALPADASMCRQLVAVAADAIDVLHRKTATTLRGDPGERWVDAHLRALARHTGHRAPVAALARLRGRLHDALSGHAFAASWIHGDYWLGNVLCDGRKPALVGIVDWEAAGPLELPAHDLLHLLLYTRKLRTGAELGQIVSAQLRGGGWSREERELLARYGVFGGCGSLSERDCLLLYWLRHVAMHARQQSAPVGSHYRVWERRNVLPVLKAL